MVCLVFCWMLVLFLVSVLACLFDLLCGLGLWLGDSLDGRLFGFSVFGFACWLLLVGVIG